MKTSTITHTIHGAGTFTYIYHLPYKSTKKCRGNLPVPWIVYGLWKSGGPKSQWSPETMYETLGKTGDQLVTHVFVGFCHGPKFLFHQCYCEKLRHSSKRHQQSQKPTVKMWFVETMQDSSHTKKIVPFAFGGQYNDIGSWRKGAR